MVMLFFVAARISSESRRHYSHGGILPGNKSFRISKLTTQYGLFGLSIVRRIDFKTLFLI